MSARDELRGTLSNTICNASNYTKRAQPHLLGSDMSVVLDKTADAILAAGYRKPRTITTVEELDALPVGSVVLHSGRAFQHYPAYPAPFDEYQKWKCGDGGFVRSTKDGSSILPATVLYEPEAAK